MSQMEPACAFGKRGHAYRIGKQSPRARNCWPQAVAWQVQGEEQEAFEAFWVSKNQDLPAVGIQGQHNGGFTKPKQTEVVGLCPGGDTSLSAEESYASLERLLPLTPCVALIRLPTLSLRLHAVCKIGS